MDSFVRRSCWTITALSVIIGLPDSSAARPTDTSQPPTTPVESVAAQSPANGDLAQRAEAIAARARSVYRDCTSYSAYIELIPRSIRAGSDQFVDRSTYSVDFAFTRGGGIRAYTSVEVNGIDGDRCWCAMPEDHEWMDAPLPTGDQREEWIKLQHWIPFAGLGLWHCIAGLPDTPNGIVTTLTNITDIKTRDYEGRPATQITGASPHPWRLKQPPIETTIIFDNETGTLREVAWESTELQREQDRLADDNRGTKPALKKSWYVLKVSREHLNDPIDPKAFKPPDDCKKVPLLSGPRGYSLRFMGRTVPGVGGREETPDLNRAMFKDKVWVLYVGLMSEDLDTEPGILSMEWLHDTLAPRGLNVLSVGNQAGPQDMKQARAWAQAHHLQHRTIAGRDGMGLSVRMGLQSYWPVIFLVDSDATVQAAFTGYSPVFSLALREWTQKLLDGQKVWTDDELKKWRDAAPK